MIEKILAQVLSNKGDSLLDFDTKIIEYSTLTANYTPMNLDSGGIYFFLSDYPIDIAIKNKKGKFSENKDQCRFYLTTDFDELYIKKAASVTAVNIEGKVFVLTMSAPFLMETIQQKFPLRTFLHSISGTDNWGALVTTFTQTINLSDRVKYFCQLESISLKRSVSNISRFRFRDLDITAMYYGGIEFTAGLFKEIDIAPKIVVPPVFVLEVEGVSNAAATDFSAEITLNGI